MKRLFTAFSLAALVSLGLPAAGNLWTMALLAPSTALAAEPLTAAQRLCEAQGGNFQEGGPPSGALYSCDMFGTSEEFSVSQVETATRLCENIYKGHLELTAAGSKRYSCEP